MRVARLFLCILLLLPVWATGQSESAPPAMPSTPPAISDDYILQPGDLLQLKVFQEPDIDRDVRISREGMVALPMIGQINLRGRNIREAEEIIRERYDRDYLVNPQINLTVLEYARRTVNVLGQVNSPGEIEFPREQGLTLMDAVSRAGGFTRLAERRKVRLTRKLESGEVQTFNINADEVIDGNSNERWPLQTDDLIFVPERFL